jgi:hypothetical protein
MLVRLEHLSERAGNRPPADQADDLSDHQRKDCRSENVPRVTVRAKPGEQRHPETREGETTGNRP